MKKQLLLLTFLLSIIGFSFGQEDVYLNVFPKNTFVKINNQTIDISQQKSKPIQLAPGQYEVEVWGPTFELMKETFTVKSGEKNIFEARLRIKSQEYLTYLDNFKAYTKKRRKYQMTKWGLVVGNLALGAVVAGAIDTKSLNNIKSDIESAERRYDAAISQEFIDLAAADHASLRDKYNKRASFMNVRRIAVVPLLAVTGFFSYKLIKKAKKNVPTEVPVFNETNPLVLEEIQFGGASYANLSLGLKFSF